MKIAKIIRQFILMPHLNSIPSLFQPLQTGTVYNVVSNHFPADSCWILVSGVRGQRRSGMSR